jgi:predicted O-methyltransferase YrrM
MADKRLEQLKKMDNGLFTVKRSYLRSKGEKGYVLYRILRPILKVRYSSFRKANDPCPWLSPSSVRFLKSYLTKEMTGLEFGSGISTLFTAPKVKHLISVEHNEEWFKMISDRFKTANISNVDYRFVPSNDPLGFKDVEFEMEKELDFKVRRDYVNYFLAAQDLPDNSLDFVLVDGRARPECLYYALPKMKKNGIVILDNSERDHYKVVFDLLKDYPMYNTTNGLTDTTFWFLQESN